MADLSSWRCIPLCLATSPQAALSPAPRTVHFGGDKSGVQGWGWDRGVMINTNLTRQFFNVSSAHANPARIHLLDPGTLLIASNSHQQCKNTVMMTTATTRKDDHKAQEAFGGVLLLLFCWSLRQDDAV